MKEETDKNTEKIEKKDRYSVEETYQVSGLVVKDNLKNQTYDVFNALAKILNELEMIRKQVA